MTAETSIDVMVELGILEPHEVAQLLKLRHSTVLDLSRRGVLPAFKIGKHWRYRRADLETFLERSGPGGNARTGMEDTLWLRRGCPAQSNAELVGRLAALVSAIGRERATVDEAAAQFGLIAAG